MVNIKEKNNMKFTFPLLISIIISQSSIGQQLTPFKDESGNFGFIDENQNLLIPALFTVVKPFSENLAVAAISGLLNPNILMRMDFRKVLRLYTIMINGHL